MTLRNPQASRVQRLGGERGQTVQETEVFASHGEQCIERIVELWQELRARQHWVYCLMRDCLKYHKFDIREDAEEAKHRQTVIMAGNGQRQTSKNSQNPTIASTWAASSCGHWRT